MADPADTSALVLMTRFGAVSRGLAQWMRSQMAEESGLTLARSHVLLALALREAPAAMSEIGAEQDLSPRSMTVLVDGLAKQGLVSRSAHTSDRRVTLIGLTEAGRKLTREVIIPAKRQAAQLLEGLSETERQDMARLLTRLGELLDQQGISVTTPPILDTDDEDVDLRVNGQQRDQARPLATRRFSRRSSSQRLRGKRS